MRRHKQEERRPNETKSGDEMMQKEIKQIDKRSVRTVRREKQDIFKIK